MKKTCYDCKVEKDITLFYHCAAKLDGYSIYCKPCQEARSKASDMKRTIDTMAFANRKRRQYRARKKLDESRRHDRITSSIETTEDEYERASGY